MKPHIITLDRQSLPEYIDLPRPNFPHTWEEHNATTTNQVVKRCINADIIITNKVAITQQNIEQLPKLKMIAVMATGVNNIDINACKKNNIIVSNIREYAKVSVPEHVMGLIFALRRQLKASNDDINAGLWSKSTSFCLFTQKILDIKDSTLVIIGKGSIGASVANMAQNLGMKVLFSELKGTQPRNNNYISFDETLKTADIISLHCPLTSKTKNLFTNVEFQRMKATSLLINTARGGIVNDKDLAQAINNNIIAGAGFDVLSEEPPQDNNVLLHLNQHPKFILTPHTAWASVGAMQILANQLITNIEAFNIGQPRNIVD